MKKLHSVLALAILSTSLMGGVAIAQDHHDNHTYVEHKEWHKGAVNQARRLGSRRQGRLPPISPERPAARLRMAHG